MKCRHSPDGREGGRGGRHVAGEAAGDLHGLSAAHKGTCAGLRSVTAMSHSLPGCGSPRIDADGFTPDSKPCSRNWIGTFVAYGSAVAQLRGRWSLRGCGVPRARLSCQRHLKSTRSVLACLRSLKPAPWKRPPRA